MRKYIFLLLLCLAFINGFSQEYQPIDTADYAQRKAFVERYKLIRDQYSKTLKAKYPGNTGKELAKNYAEFQESFRKEIKNRDYVFNSNFTEMLRTYFEMLKNKNQNIPDDIKILVARDNTPNAFCVQDGVFIVNMGLFNWIDNEEQLISILGHELGHKLLTHSENWQKKLIETELNNKTQVSEISSSKINKTDKAFKLYKNQMYESSVFRRKNESDADSIGYVMYRNTGLKKSEYINSLRNLQKFDTISPTVVKVETYRELFSSAEHPFKEKWLKMEDFSGYNYSNFKEKFNKDSLSTHPEVVERINLLKKNFPEISQDEPSIKSEDKDFLALKKMARFEILPNFYHSEDYGLGIYTAMQFLQDGEEETYYKNWLGKNFAKIYEARKNYNLNRYLDRVDPKNQSESYQQFLNFMWNLSLEDIKNIADLYTQKSP
ncbi:MAG: M48 family metalloprotease [Bacteroidetes bacterium]|nr:M48 family metalloprotease [Bacteroidota bacterium]